MTGVVYDLCGRHLTLCTLDSRWSRSPTGQAPRKAETRATDRTRYEARQVRRQGRGDKEEATRKRRQGRGDKEESESVWF